jgi:hypothetical protein
MEPNPLNQPVPTPPPAPLENQPQPTQNLNQMQPQADLPQTPPEKPKSSKKLLIVAVLFIVVILLAVGGVAAYVYMGNSNNMQVNESNQEIVTENMNTEENETTSKTSSISIENWITFANNKFNYTIDHPKNYVSGCDDEEMSECFIFYSDDPSVKFEDLPQDGEYAGYISISDYGYAKENLYDQDNENIKVNEALEKLKIGEEYTDDSLEDEALVRLEDMNINGIDAKVFASTDVLSGTKEKFKEVHVVKGDKYFIIFGFLNNARISEEEFDKIVSTFKFLN